MAMLVGLGGCGRHTDKPASRPTEPAAPPLAVVAGPTPAGPLVPVITPAPPRLIQSTAPASDAPTAPIPLRVVNPPGVPFPATFGIPFPQGAVSSIEHLRMETPDGIEVPAQFSLLAAWPDASVKAALGTVVVPGTGAGYMLRYGPPAARSAYTTGLSCDSNAQTITITTGPLKLQLNRDRFHVIEQAWRDVNKDRLYQDSEQVLSAPGDLVMTDANGETYRASAFHHPEYTLEECGPMRAVLRAAGKLETDRGKPLIDFIVRLYAYAQQEYVIIEPTVVDTRPENVEAPKGFTASSYELVLPARLEHAPYTFGGETQLHLGDVSGEQTLMQRGQMRFIDGHPEDPFFELRYDGPGAGRKAPGWVEAGMLGVAVRYFWQQFPKSLTVSPAGVRVGLHPLAASTERVETDPKQYTRPTTFYFPREGGAKTYQLLVRFGSGNTDKYDEALENPPRLMADPQWYAQSGVFGHLLEACDKTLGYDDHLMEGIYKPSVERMKDAGGLAIVYGWRDFGDRLRPGWADIINGIRTPAFYNDTHIGAHSFFIQYVRTQDPRWWELAETASRHWMDLDVSHTSRHGYHHVPIDLGPGEGHLIKHDVVDHTCRNIHNGHAHLSGLADYYLLTGDKRALEVLKEVGGWWAKAAPYFFTTPIDNPHGAEAERDYAWPLFVLNEAYRATGDVTYLKGGAQIVKHVIEWWQQPQDHLVAGKVVGRNDWRQGTGYWTMHPKCDNCPEGYNGTNPWMAGPLLSSVIQFSDYQRGLNLVDERLTREMLLQCMNYVVKYGWDAEKRKFVYSEAARGTDGELNLILFPLAYLGRLVQQGVEHPQWYDTAPRWLEIATDAYLDFQQVKWRGSNSQGFYGYELVWPADFFGIMYDLDREGKLPRGG